MSDAPAATATTPEPAEPTPETPPTETATVDVDALQAELDKLKATSRKWEDRAKANSAAAKELETLRQSTMTEQEQAVAKAAAEARAATLREVGTLRVDDAVRTAAAGRQVDVDALLEGLDRSRFLDDDHQPDRDAITAWVDRIAPAADPAKPQPVDLGQGPRTPTPTSSTTPLGNDDALVADLKSALGIG